MRKGARKVLPRRIIRGRGEGLFHVNPELVGVGWHRHLSAIRSGIGLTGMDKCRCRLRQEMAPRRRRNNLLCSATDSRSKKFHSLATSSPNDCRCHPRHERPDKPVRLQVPLRTTSDAAILWRRFLGGRVKVPFYDLACPREASRRIVSRSGD